MRRATTGLIAALALSLSQGAIQAAPNKAAADSSAKAKAARRTPGGALALAYRAFEAGDYPSTLRHLGKINRAKILNQDYVLYLSAQASFLLGDLKRAQRELAALEKMSDSRFQSWAKWRHADCLWQMGSHGAARKEYAALLGGKGSRDGDRVLAQFRIAEADAKAGKTDAAVRRLQALRLESPGHMLEPIARARLVELGGEPAAALSSMDHIARAIDLRANKHWDEAIGELRLVPDSESVATVRLRDFWIGMTLFKMRRHYQRASDILLGLYKDMGSRAAEALFHGARALSRVDRDADAIVQYQKVVKEYPRSEWAAEAQFLSGWLEFNMGHYRRALPHLEEMQKKYPRSKFAGETVWYIAYSHFLLGEYAKALPLFDKLAKQNDRLEGGQGHYWQARSLEKMDKKDDAVRAYRALVGRYPLSWYSLLARARLKSMGIEIPPFGESPRDPANAPDVATTVDESLAKDPLIRKVDELIAADLGVFAGEELHRGERAFLKRHPRSKAMALVLDRYRKAGNWNRPWYLAVVSGGVRASDAPPKGAARVWWEHALPLAFHDLVDKWRHLGDSPTYYIYSIMRKESGFDPHVHSHANAMGLLQMIPRTTRRVVAALGIPYTDDLLFDPESNIRTGAWYVGKLLHKFKGQIPLGAGSFNSGPRPVMEWIDKNGDRPIDELVELVSYRQTRGYMKKVTEIYARYLYLYEGKVYEQPLVVDTAYVRDELTY